MKAVTMIMLTCSVSTFAVRLQWQRERKPAVKRSLGPLQVNRGQVTFDSEGNDNPNSIYFSRKPHVPSSASGITIGRGYDLKLRKQSEVYNDLTNSDMSSSIAQKFSYGIGLKGDCAKNYLKAHNLENHIISHEEQKNFSTLHMTK